MAEITYRLFRVNWEERAILSAFQGLDTQTICILLCPKQWHEVRVFCPEPAPIQTRVERLRSSE